MTTEILSSIAKPLYVGSYTYRLLVLLQNLLAAGFWYGLSIFFRKIFPNKPTMAENAPQNTQTTFA
jgi:hypothetical protein